jgi:hypothetical protein
LEGLAMEDVGIFYVHLVNFLANWHFWWQFGTFCHLLVHFYPFWYLVPRKIWQPCLSLGFSESLVFCRKCRRFLARAPPAAPVSFKVPLLLGESTSCRWHGSGSRVGPGWDKLKGNCKKKLFR